MLRIGIAISFLIGSLFVHSCSSLTEGMNVERAPTQTEYPQEKIQRENREAAGGSLLSLNRIFGKNEGGGGAAMGIGVNAYLWQATLESLSFMPLDNADPFGGVIITEWHSSLDSPGERFKMTVLINTKELRADGLTVSVFRQIWTKGAGLWVDAPISSNASREIEDAILTKARELRIDSIAGG